MNTTKQTSTMTQNASPTTQTLKSSESSHHHQQTVLEDEKRKSYNNKILKHKKRKKKTHLNQSPDPCRRQCNTVIGSITTTGVDKCEARKCDEVEKVLNMCNGPQANVSLSKRLLRGKEHCFDLGFRFIRFISSYLIHYFFYELTIF